MINIYTWNLFVLYFWASTLQNKAHSNQNKGHLGSRYIYIYILMCECTTTHQTTWLHRICFFGCGMLNNHSRIRIWQTFLVLKDCEVGQHLLRWAMVASYFPTAAIESGLICPTWWETTWLWWFTESSHPTLVTASPPSLPWRSG